jgi:uncharacterized protein
MTVTRVFSVVRFVFLGIVILISFTSPAIAASASALPADTPVSDRAQITRVITVSGSAQRQVQPDIARITVAVEQRGMELDALRRQVNETVQRLLQALQPLRIAERDVDSSAISIRPEFSFERAGVRRFDGYVLTRQIQITLRKLADLGTVIERSLDAGANQISQPVFDHSDRSGIERSVLALAASDARANAIATAKGVDMMVGDTLKLFVTNESPIPRMATMRVAAMDAGAAESSYQPGSLSFQVTVNAEFELIASRP